jgi:type I restriction enzyme S subunit
MFGDPALNPRAWPTRTLGAASIRFSDGPFGSNLKTEHYVETGVRVIRLQNIGVGEFVDKDKAFISASHFSTLQKHTCLPGDILIGTLGDPNLRAVIQPNCISVALNKADCVQMRVNPEICTPEYVAALLNCPSTEKMAQNKILGQTRLRISMGRLREFSIPIPPLDLQRAFAACVAQINKLKAHHHTHLARLDELFASLQHRAFRGEL